MKLPSSAPIKAKRSTSSSSSAAAGLTGTTGAASTDAMVTISCRKLPFEALDSSMGFAAPYATIMSITKSSSTSVSFIFADLQPRECIVEDKKKMEPQLFGLIYSIVHSFLFGL